MIEDDFYVPEDQCLVCSTWPPAERAQRRRQQASYVRMRLKRTCAYCMLEFWDAISLKCKDKEELDAWIEAVRQERRKPPAMLPPAASQVPSIFTPPNPSSLI
jgi:hypothetical protein